MTEPVVQVSKTIDAPAEAVWRALTTPAKLKTYFMGAEVESDWQIGHPIRFRGEYEGKAYEDHGEIRSFEPNRRLAFSHFSPLSGAEDAPENYNLITIDLSPQGGQTAVTLSQSKLTGGSGPSDPSQREQFAANWRKVLDGLGRAAQA